MRVIRTIGVVGRLDAVEEQALRDKYGAGALRGLGYIG